MSCSPGYFILFLLFIGIVDCGEWKYSGPTGPKNWHELFPSACSGTSQSPIDIQPEMTQFDPKLKDFAIWYDPPKPGSRMYVKNNGHAIQVNTDGDFFVTNGGLNHVYKVAQFHFHWGSEDHMGSEHLLDSIAYPIEMHIVTYNSDFYSDIAEAVIEKGGLAVLGVLFEVQEKPNKHFESIIKALEYVRNPEEENMKEIEAISLRNLLPEDISKYYRYNGSLTTPGCFETVTWTVFHQKQKISFGQLMKFRRVLQHRYRKNHHKHHKRSTWRRQVREAKQGAEAVLEEIGIKTDSIQKGELIASLVNQQNKDIKNTEETRGNMKNTHNYHGHQTKNTADPDMTRVALDEESAKRAEDSMKQYSERLEIPTPTGHNTVHDPPAVNEPPVWIQENLVNNFRPVQPLNNRMVYRSFKLKDIYIKKDMAYIPQAEPPYLFPKVDTVSTKQENKNSANSIQVSLITLIFVFIRLFL